MLEFMLGFLVHSDCSSLPYVADVLFFAVSFSFSSSFFFLFACICARLLCGDLVVPLD